MQFLLFLAQFPKSSFKHYSKFMFWTIGTYLDKLPYVFYILIFFVPLLILIGQLTYWTHKGLGSSWAVYENREIQLKFAPVTSMTVSLLLCTTGCGWHSWCDKIFSRARKDSTQGSPDRQSHLPQTARA